MTLDGDPAVNLLRLSAEEINTFKDKNIVYYIKETKKLINKIIIAIIIILIVTACKLIIG